MRCSLFFFFISAVLVVSLELLEQFINSKKLLEWYQGFSTAVLVIFYLIIFPITVKKATSFRVFYGVGFWRGLGMFISECRVYISFIPVFKRYLSGEELPDTKFDKNSLDEVKRFE